MAAPVYLLSEFRDKDAVARAIHALRATGVADQDLDLFSEEPIEFAKGVLDRPSHMSLVAVVAAIVTGSAVTGLVYLAQNAYAVNTGGMPTYSSWGTGVITYETTMLGAVLATFFYFLWESGLIRKRDKSAPVPVVPPERICLRVRTNGDTAKSTALLEQSGAVSVERKASL